MRTKGAAEAREKIEQAIDLQRTGDTGQAMAAMVQARDKLSSGALVDESKNEESQKRQELRDLNMDGRIDEIDAHIQQLEQAAIVASKRGDRIRAESLLEQAKKMGGQASSLAFRRNGNGVRKTDEEEKATPIGKKDARGVELGDGAGPHSGGLDPESGRLPGSKPIRRKAWTDEARAAAAEARRSRRGASTTGRRTRSQRMADEYSEMMRARREAAKPSRSPLEGRPDLFGPWAGHPMAGKAWTDEARAAALAARRQMGGGHLYDVSGRLIAGRSPEHAATRLARGKPGTRRMQVTGTGTRPTFSTFTHQPSTGHVRDVTGRIVGYSRREGTVMIEKAEHYAELGPKPKPGGKHTVTMGGKVRGRHPSRAEAVAQVQAINLSKLRAEGRRDVPAEPKGKAAPQMEVWDGVETK